MHAGALRDTQNGKDVSPLYYRRKINLKVKVLHSLKKKKMPFTVYEFNSYIDLPGKRVKSKKTSFSIIIQASTKFKLLNCLTVSCFDDSTMKQSVQKYTTHPKV